METHTNSTAAEVDNNKPTASDASDLLKNKSGENKDDGLAAEKSPGIPHDGFEIISPIVTSSPTERKLTLVRAGPSSPLTKDSLDVPLWESLRNDVFHTPNAILKWCIEGWRNAEVVPGDIPSHLLRDLKLKETFESTGLSPSSHSVLNKNRKLVNMVRGVLAKVTDNNFETVCKDLLNLPIRQSEDAEIDEVILTIFQKASNPGDSIYSSMYAQLVKRLYDFIAKVEEEKHIPEEKRVSRKIRKNLVDHCQKRYENIPELEELRKEDAKYASYEHQIRQGTADEEILAEQERLSVERKMLVDTLKANVKFLGHLFLNELVGLQDVVAVLQMLLFGRVAKQTERVIKDYELDQFAELMRLIGERIEADEKHKAWIEQAKHTLMDIFQTHPTMRVRFVAQNLVEYMDNGYKKKERVAPVHAASRINHSVPHEPHFALRNGKTNEEVPGLLQTSATEHLFGAFAGVQAKESGLMYIRDSLQCMEQTELFKHLTEEIFKVLFSAKDEHVIFGIPRCLTWLCVEQAIPRMKVHQEIIQEVASKFALHKKLNETFTESESAQENADSGKLGKESVEVETPANEALRFLENYIRMIDYCIRNSIPLLDSSCYAYILDALFRRQKSLHEQVLVWARKEFLQKAELEQGLDAEESGAAASEGEAPIATFNSPKNNLVSKARVKGESTENNIIKYMNVYIKKVQKVIKNDPEPPFVDQKNVLLTRPYNRFRLLPTLMNHPQMWAQDSYSSNFSNLYSKDNLFCRISDSANTSLSVKIYKSLMDMTSITWNGVESIVKIPEEPQMGPIKMAYNDYVHIAEQDDIKPLFVPLDADPSDINTVLETLCAIFCFSRFDPDVRETLINSISSAIRTHVKEGRGLWILLEMYQVWRELLSLPGDGFAHTLAILLENTDNTLVTEELVADFIMYVEDMEKCSFSYVYRLMGVIKQDREERKNERFRLSKPKPIV